MEPSDLSSSRGEAGELVNKHRPNISIPARNPEEAFQNSSDVTPSPMTIISSFLADHEKNESFSQMLAGPLPPIASVPCMEKESSSPNKVNDEMPSSLPPPCASQSPLPLPLLSSSPQASPPLPPSGGLSVEERSPLLPPPAPGPPGTAFGHKSAASGSGRSNIARFKTMTPSRLPIPRSPCLTIPPGLSPTTLLDSPVLLSTGQAEPSPTTGTFPLPPISQGNGPGLSDTSQRTPDEDHNSTFAFKPTPMINRNPPSPLSKMGPSQLQSQVQPEANPISSTTSNFFLSQTLAQSASASFWNAQKAMAPLPVATPLDIGSEVSAKSESPNQPAVLAQPLVIERPSEDGYNWRKYGQKQVKGSEFPRSYYKCTHPNCSVKKKVERSHDGQVTEIVYKGEHDHPKPQSTRRSSMAAIHREGLPASHEDALRRANGTTQNSEPSLGSVSDVEGDGEGSKADDGDDDEPDSKRRKEVAGDAPSNVPLRTIREPRVVVQTMSEVDILDDGYRWRKYGQKVVKGNPHPRSYYKCTNLGCSVRKHVERSSTDPRAVITTYEGKHNHDVPAAKTSQHESTAGLHASPVVSHSNSMVPSISSALSLQDQYLMGKMREDRLKADVGIAEFDLVNTHVPSLPMFPVQVASRSQGISDPLIPASVSYIGHVGMNGVSLGGPDNSGHPIMVRPKEEQDEGNLSSWPSMYVKSSSSSQGMSERLA